MQYIEIIADTVNGAIQEFPIVLSLPCYSVTPIGNSVVRGYTINDDIVATNVFLVKVGEDIFGTRQFNSFLNFVTYKDAICAPCSGFCSLLINNCVATINGCALLLN